MKDLILQYYLPQKLSPNRLDRYLASGWFRTVNMLFRAKVTCFDNDICSPINIRFNLFHHTLSKHLRKLNSRNSRKFRHEICKATITTRKEQLFRQHQKRFRSFLCNSLEEFLVLTHRFDTYEINIYDDDLLVAVSYFDAGRNSLMSLLGLFDIGYANYSLGTYTMLLEIEYAKATNRQWYYPGYVHERPSMYDYKLRFGNPEVYNWESKKWLKGIHPHALPNIADKIKDKIQLLEEKLLHEGIYYQRKVYLFFGWHYFNQMYEQLFRCPLLLLLQDGRVISYDAEIDQYIVVKWDTYVPFRDIQMTLAPDFDPQKHYMDVMRVVETNLQTIEIDRATSYIKDTLPIQQAPIFGRIFGKVVG